MSAKFSMIPKIYAGDLPEDVETELMSWSDELCYHGDNGCVFSLSGDTIKEIPLFVAWMIEIGAWNQEQVKLPCYKDFCLERGLNPSGEPYHFDEFYKHYGTDTTSHYLSVAMTGT